MDKLITEIKVLSDRLSAIDTEQKAIIDKATSETDGRLTDEQRASYDALNTEYDTKKAEFDALKADLKRQQDLQSRQKPDTALPRRAATGTSAPLPDGDNSAASAPRVKVTEIPASVKRGGRLNYFRGESNGMSAEQRAYRFGMFALAKASLDMPTKFRFSKAMEFAHDQWAVSTEGGGDNAGVLVPEEFGSDLIALREKYGVVRRIFKYRPMSSDTRSDPRSRGGLTAHFVGEAQPGTESTKKWDKVALTAKKIMVLSRYTNELSEDSVISIGDDLAYEVSYAFAQKEDACGLLGDGTSQYGGITGAIPALAAAAGTVTTTSAGGIVVGTGNLYSELTLADFTKVLGVLPQYATTPNTCWVASKAFFHNVMQRLELAAGGTTATEVRDGQQVYRFLGYPVEISQVMPVAEANSQLCCLLGDFTLGASFGDRRDERIDFSEHASIGGESLWERDEIGVRGTERFDINVHDVGNSTTAGPIVGLQTLNA